MEVRKIPRGTFATGALVGVALGLPLLTLVLEDRLHAARLHVLLFSCIFAGLPMCIAGGGVARLVAHRLAESAGPRLAVGLALGAVAMGVAGMGAALLVALPLGELPEKAALWWPLLAMGLGAGAATGSAIGLLVAGRTLRHLRQQGAY